MTRRITLTCFLCACAVVLGGCAALTPKTAIGPAVAVPAPAISTTAPAATSASSAVSVDSGTPIPDLHDTAPLIHWQDLSVTPADVKYGNLWNYLGTHLSLSDDQGDGRVQGELNWFVHHGAYLQRVAIRARPYLYYIVQQLRARKMPLDIALLPVVESAFDPFAYSRARAAGLWQFIPGTGRRWGLKQNWWYDGRRDIVASTRAALDHLQALHKEFNGNWLLALAAYDSGSGTVSWAIKRNERLGLPTDFWHLDLPAETRAYVPRLLAICRLVAKSGHYGVQLPVISNKPYLAQVNVGGQIDLATAARLAAISNQQMSLLNPGFNRWATDPDGPYTLLVPLDKKAHFKTALANLAPHDRVQWATHVVRHGDTLGGLAYHYDTTVAVLRQLNGIRGNLIRLHQTLLIPASRQTLANVALVAEARMAEHRYGRAQHAYNGRIIHRVRNGESLWTIARRYGVDVASLAHWNRLNSRSILRVGQRLIVWPHRALRVYTAYVGGPDKTDVQRTIYYTVHEGDSLYSISSRFRVSIADIANWNRINEHNFLHAGQLLKLYVDVADQSTSS